MITEHDDLTELFDHVFDRLETRMSGLSDTEWAWLPTTDDRVGLRWRLGHIADMLAEERNATWLGVHADTRPDVLPAASAADALTTLRAAFVWWRDIVASLDDTALGAPIGEIGGAYGSSTGRSFVLHVADELIHHGAEAALLRDLYTAQYAQATDPGES